MTEVIAMTSPRFDLPKSPRDSSPPSGSTTPTHRRRNSSNPKATRQVRINTGAVVLKHQWTLWFAGEEDTPKQIGTFDTVQQFWQYFNNMVNPSEFPKNSALYLFKGTVTPTETSAGKHKEGGYWNISCSRSETSKVWIKMLLALIGEQFSRRAEIFGICLNIQSILNKVSMWNAKSADAHSIEVVTDQIKKLVEPNISSLNYSLFNPSKHSSQIDIMNRTNGVQISSSAHHHQGLQSSNEEEQTNPTLTAMNGSRKYVSSSDLSNEESSAKIRHKKSSSFSIPQFPSDMDSEPKFKHRKTKSDSQNRKNITSRKSQSFSSDTVSYRSANTGLNSLRREIHKVDTSLPAFSIKSPVASTQHVPVPQKPAVAPMQLIAIILLFILVVTGFILTPK